MFDDSSQIVAADGAARLRSSSPTMQVCPFGDWDSFA
jgi:hypothetical protein